MPEGQKTVDIDTSGPDTEIELENSNTETDNIEISNETTTEDSVESKDSPEKSNEQSDVQTDEPKNKEEVEQYSDGVQKRISKLTKKWREAERQKDEALTYAERVMAAKKQTDDKMSRYEPLFFKNTVEVNAFI